VHPFPQNGSERHVDLVCGASAEHMNLQVDTSRSCLHLFDAGCNALLFGRIGEHRNARCRWHQFVEKPQPLCTQFTADKIDASRVAPRAAKTGDKTESDRVFANTEHDRNCGGCILSGNRGGSAARYRNDTHLPIHQISRQLRQPIVSTLCPTILDRDVLTLEVAGFSKTSSEGTQEPCIRFDSASVEQPNDRHRRLLRTSHGRPSRYR
jgi:hypothetical protein